MSQAEAHAELNRESLRRLGVSADDGMEWMEGLWAAEPQLRPCEEWARRALPPSAE